MKSPHRTVALIVVVTGGLAFVVLAAVLIPWHPVPGGPVQPVPAARVFTEAQLARFDGFSDRARLLGWSSLAVSLLVASLLGFTRLGRRLMDALRGPWWVRVPVGALVVLLAGTLATLPLRLVFRQQLLDYDLTRQSVGGFLRDVAVSFAVAWVVTSVVLLVLVGCSRRWTRAWPAVAGGVLAWLLMVGSFVYPVLVEPLFNSFEPLPDGPLRAGIFRLAAQEDVEIDDVLVADASRRTTTLNAYVSGFGDTRRVVVYDNLVTTLPEAQTLSVVAHELAHAHHDDVLTGSVIGSVGAFASVGLLGLLVGVGGGRRRDEDADGPPVLSITPGGGLVAAVPLVLALSAWGTLLASPVENTISRQIETRADVDALETTHDPDAFIAMQRQLALRGLGDPTPPAWSQFWFGSHPTSLERVAIAERLGR